MTRLHWQDTSCVILCVVLLLTTSLGCQVTTPIFGRQKTRISPPATGSLRSGKADSYYRGSREEPSRNDRAFNDLDRSTIDSDTSLDAVSRNSPLDRSVLGNDGLNNSGDRLTHESDGLVWRLPGQFDRGGQQFANRQYPYRGTSAGGYLANIPNRNYVDLSPTNAGRVRQPLSNQVAERDLLGPIDDLTEITNLPGDNSGLARQPRIRGIRYGDNRLE